MVTYYFFLSELDSLTFLCILTFFVYCEALSELIIPQFVAWYTVQTDWASKFNCCRFTFVDFVLPQCCVLCSIMLWCWCYCGIGSVFSVAVWLISLFTGILITDVSKNWTAVNHLHWYWQTRTTNLRDRTRTKQTGVATGVSVYIPQNQFTLKRTKPSAQR